MPADEEFLLVPAQARAAAVVRPERAASREGSMSTVRRMAFVPFTPRQMYDLVNDVAAYPRFLPWCAGSEVLVDEPDRMRARLQLRKGPLDAAFTTDNRLVPGRSITLSLVDGPFSRLHGQWNFEAADGGSVVSLELEFEFSGRLIGKVLATAFKPIADSLVEAFKSRAYAVYGH